ncbi:MAG: SpoIID/LytB domain-containing protein [Acetatifactor sp.]
MDRNGFNKSQRMQLKAFICLLGVLLLIILIVGKLIVTLVHRQEEETQPPVPHIPVVQELSNVWIMEEDTEGILIFRDGEREHYSWGELPESGMAESENGSEKPKNGTTEPENAVYRPMESVREQVADIVLTDGSVTDIVLKKEKINGKVLRADAEGVEIEGYGKILLAEDYRGYRLYDSLEMCTTDDLCFGYSFTDFCIENGEICGILMVKEEAMKYIRVLIKAEDYAGNLHAQPVITADTDFTVVYGTYDNLKTESHAAGEELEFGFDNSYFEGDRVCIVPDVLTGKICITNLNRSQGTPSYRGQIELLRTEEGIAVINEVLLEDYLYSVVPSEMPARYPMEALKAQAICARTYAYGHMEHAGYPRYGAHVDDSTSYQVYNNILEQETTTTAVKETYGQLLFTEEGELAGTYYYSTSCGVGSDANVWKTEAAGQITYLHARELSHAAMEQELTARISGEAAASAEDEIGEALREEEVFADFISSVNSDDFEASEGWYRWNYEVKEIDTEHMREVLQKRYAANSKLVLTWQDGEYVSREIGELDNITDIYIEKRGAGGVADELVIETADEKYKVISEHNIRYVLNDGESKVCRQDGSRIASPNLLPSGFFVITTGKEDGNVVGYTINGGGFGHGVGMSQNGARHMAECGYSAEEILLYFYESCALKSIYE